MYVYGVIGEPRVLDGDTIDCTIDLGFSIRFAARVRLAGIDAPEVHTADAREKAMGLRARDRLAELLSRGWLRVQTELDRSEKYGRVLGTIWVGDDTVSVNEQLVAERRVWRYDGGTKRKALDDIAP